MTSPSHTEYRTAAPFVRHAVLARVGNSRPAMSVGGSGGFGPAFVKGPRATARQIFRSATADGVRNAMLVARDPGKPLRGPSSGSGWPSVAGPRLQIRIASHPTSSPSGDGTRKPVSSGPRRHGSTPGRSPALAVAGHREPGVVATGPRPITFSNTRGSTSEICTNRPSPVGAGRGE